MKIQNKRILSFMLAMLFVLSLVPACLAASASDIGGVLEPGVPYEVSTPDEVLLTFTPEEDGYYVFSSAQGEMYVDTYAYLFASQEDYINWDWIAGNDDGGDNNNFYLVCDLEKDNEYILSVRHYDEFEDIYYTVSVEKAPAPESIFIESDEYIMYEDDIGNIYAYFNDNSLYGGIQWTVSDPSVLDINDAREYNGGGRIEVTALKAGTVTLTATCGEISDSAVVIVEERPVLEGVRIAGDDFNAFIDECHYVYVDLLPGGAIGEVEWSIDDETVATIEYSDTSYAEILTLKEGTATLTATCGEFSDSITITVVPPIKANDDMGKVVFSYYEDRTMLQYDVDADGWYSLDVNCDGYSYVAFGDGDKNYVSEWVNGEESFVFELTAGTYYAYLYSDSDYGCVIDISLNKCDAPVAITKSGFIEDSMTVSYYDRFIVEWELTDEDSNNCDIYFEFSGSDVIHEYSGNRIYDATGIGTTTLTMYKYDYDTDEYTVLDTIEITVTDAPEVKLDSITELSIEDDTRKGYKFVAPEDGDYVFWSSTEGDMDPAIRVYGADGVEIVSSDDAIGMNFSCAAYMEEGEIYYLQLRGYDDLTEFKLHINKRGIKVSDAELYINDWYYIKRDGDTYCFVLDKEEETWIEVDFIYDVPFNYDVEYVVDFSSDDKNVADPDAAGTLGTDVLLGKAGKTKLTFTYSDSNGVEIEKSITVIVIDDTEFDSDPNGKFDAFDVGFMNDVMNGEKQANLEQYKKMDVNGDKFVNAGDINAAIALLAVNEADKTAPVIEGIKDGETYNADTAFSVKGQDIASVTVNGNALDVIFGSDAKEGYVLSAEGVLKLNDKATEYIVVATDMNGNETTVKVTVEPKKADVTPPDGDPDTPEEKIMKGDINGNDKIDMTDYILLKRAYFGTFKFNDKQNKAGDINKNNKIDMTDYILLKRAYFGTFTIK